MSGSLATILGHLIALSPYMGGLVFLWLTYELVKRWRKDRRIISLPVSQIMTWLLLMVACNLICASLLAGSGHLVGGVIGSPGDGMAVIGALLGSITGSVIGWTVQRRSTL
jgi:hypothetical protein